MIKILDFITTNNKNWRIVMLKKHLKKIITALFLIVISNNAYALFSDSASYYSIIEYSSRKHQFWVIVDKFSDLIGVKQHRKLATEGMRMLDECSDEKKDLNICKEDIVNYRNEKRGADYDEVAFRNNPILAYESAIFFAGVMSILIYGTDVWKWHKSWKEHGLEILDSYVKPVKKVILDELVKKLNSSNIEISSLKEDKKNIDKKIKLYNDFFVTIPNYYKKEIGDIGNNSVYEKKLRSLLAINKKLKKANSDLKIMK